MFINILFIALIWKPNSKKVKTDSNMNITDSINDINNSVDYLKTELLKALNEKLPPIIIKSVKVINTYYDDHNNLISIIHDRLIHSSETISLFPEIEYEGLWGRYKTITIFIKFIQIGGLNYLYEYDLTISDSGKFHLNPLRKTDNSYWKAGNYRYEIWYDGIMLKDHKFTIINTNKKCLNKFPYNKIHNLTT